MYIAPNDEQATAIIANISRIRHELSDADQGLMEEFQENSSLWGMSKSIGEDIKRVQAHLELFQEAVEELEAVDEDYTGHMAWEQKGKVLKKVHRRAMRHVLHRYSKEYSHEYAANLKMLDLFDSER